MVIFLTYTSKPEWPTYCLIENFAKLVQNVQSASHSGVFSPSLDLCAYRGSLTAANMKGSA